MDYLRTFAEEYGLRQIVSTVAEWQNVQGAVLTFDDWWLNAWKYEESGGKDWDWWRWMWRHSQPSPLGPESDLITPPWIPQRPPDLNWRPPFWEELCRLVGHQEKMPPVRLIVCLRPPANGERLLVPDLPRFRLPVSFEVRPMARLSANHRSATRPVVGGVSVGSGAKVYGTLGGIVEDSAGARHGMTCAHVFPSLSSVDQPALHDDSQATTIGTNTRSIALQSCSATGPCNPYSNDPHISNVDSTLVQLRPGITADLEILSIGPLAGVVAKNSMTPGQEVTFVGRTSGNRIAEVGGLAVFYRLQLGGQIYCFRDLFEIRWRSFIRTLLGPVVQAGDSGAWVCAETDQGAGWCGQVIGEDRRVGYASFAENIVGAWAIAGERLRVT